MLKKCISKYIDNLLKLNIISRDEYEKYEYYLLCLAESIIVISIMLIIGTLFQCTLNVVTFIICFFLIRNRSGGFHLNSFSKCFIGTIILELIGIISIKYVPTYIGNILDILSIVSYVVLMVFGTLNHPNINFNKEEYKASKTMSRMISSLIIALIIFFKSIKASVDTIMFMEYAVTISGTLLFLGIITKQYVPKSTL